MIQRFRRYVQPVKLVPFFKISSYATSSAGAWVSADGYWHFVAHTGKTKKHAKRRWRILACGSRERILWLHSIGLGADTYFPSRRAAVAALEEALPYAPIFSNAPPMAASYV